MWTNLPLYLLLVGMCCYCTPDNNVREQAKAEVEQMANAAKSQQANAQQQAPPPGSSTPTTGETFSIVMGNAEVGEGEKACLPVTATGFNELIGLQFSIRWNREELTYVAVENLELVDLGPQNFGDTHAELGVVALSWIHQSLQGVTLRANSKLFDICFTPNTKAGSKVDVRFEARPVAYEVININEELLQFSGTNGQIRVK